MRKRSVAFSLVILSIILIICSGGCNGGAKPPPSSPIIFQDDFNDPHTITANYEKFDDPIIDTFSIKNGVLEITANEDQDLWSVTQTDNATKKMGAPILLYNKALKEKAWWVEAFVNAVDPEDPGKPQAVNTQVGLFVFKDRWNWIFFGLTNHDFTLNVLNDDMEIVDTQHFKHDGLILAISNDAESRIIHEWSVTEGLDEVYLRIDKRSSSWEFRIKYKKNDQYLGEIGALDDSNVPFIYQPKVGMGVKTLDLGEDNISKMGRGIFDDFIIGKREN